MHNRQTPDHGDIHMIEKAAAVLAGGIDHSTGKAALRHEPDERVVWSLIGKCDSIRLTRHVQLAQRAHAILLRRVCIQTGFDVARASVDDSRRSPCERLRLGLGAAVPNGPSTSLTSMISAPCWTAVSASSASVTLASMRVTRKLPEKGVANCSCDEPIKCVPALLIASPF